MGHCAQVRDGIFLHEPARTMDLLFMPSSKKPKVASSLLFNRLFMIGRRAVMVLVNVL